MDDKVFPRYQKIKEKTVWRTIDFELDLEQILPSFYDKYEDPFKSYLKKNHKHLIKLCKEFNINNLRTLRFFFENMKRPFEVNAGFFLKTDKDKIVYETLLILSNHYKSGKKLKDENGNRKSYLDAIIRGLSMTLGRNSEIIKNEEDTYLIEQNEFISLYFSNRTSSYRLLNFAVELISSGYFNEDIFKSEIDELNLYYTKNDPWHLAINRFIKPLTAECESDYFSTVTEVISFLGKSKYGIHEIMALANNFEIWSKEGVKYDFSKQDFYEKLKTALELSSDNEGYMVQGYPSEDEAIKRLKSDEYTSLLKQARIHQKKIWQKSNSSDITETIKWLEKSDVLPAESIATILNSNDDEVYKRLLTKLTSSTSTLKEFKRVYQRMILLYMNVNTEERKMKLRKLLTDIKSTVAEDSIKTYIITSMEFEYISSLEGYKTI